LIVELRENILPERELLGTEGFKHMFDKYREIFFDDVLQECTEKLAKIALAASTPHECSICLAEVQP
jgi:alkylhydroperoxidase/carboxymuconolactone decarboxylase family protein YurZ